MKHLLIILSFILLNSPLFGQSEEKPCYLSVKTSGDFNPVLISEISTSLVSQYIKEVLTIPSSGIRGDTKCVYDVSVTSDAGKTFVSLRGEGINSFGDSSLEGTDGFQQSILRSIYRSQRDKRGLICTDYPNLLEECGGVVRKKKKKEVVKLSSPKKVQLEETKGKPVVKTKPTKPKSWIGTLFKCQVGCLHPYWDSAGNYYDENMNLITKGTSVKKTKPKRDCSQKWECIVPPCDWVDENGCLIGD